MILFLKFPLEDTLGGAEFHTLKLAQYFRNQGRDVALFTSDKKLLKLFLDSNLPAEYLWAGWEPTSKWSLLLWPVTYVISKAKFKQILSNIPAGSTPQESSPAGSTIFMQSLTEKLVLTPVLSLRVRPEQVEGRTKQSHGIATPLTKLGARDDKNCNIVWLEHKIPGRWLKLNPLKFQYLKLAKRVQIITVSNFAKEKFVELGVPADKVKVIYPTPSVTLERSDRVSKDSIVPPAAGLQNNTQSFTLGILSRLDPEKGVYDFLKLILPTAQKYNWRIIVAGQGPEKKKIEKLPVKTVGFVNDLDRFFSQISVLCYPTKVEEAFGISVLEAMARGVPVVANNKGAIPEIINNPIPLSLDGRGMKGEDEYNGFLIDRSSDWVIYLKLLSQDQNLYHQTSHNAKLRAQDFSEEKLFKAFSDLI